MSFPAVAPAPTYALEYPMPKPGPLGRLVYYRRHDLELSQEDLSDLTEKFGRRVRQNTISRLESGKAYRMNDREQLESLGKALGYEGDEAFIIAAYGPKGPRPAVDDPVDPPSTIVRIVRELADLDDEQTARLDRFVAHVLHSPAEADGPSPEERIARFARELAERHDRPTTTTRSFVS